MEVITTNPIIYDDSEVDEDYMNASGRRGTPRKRKGLNRAIGVIPVVAGARYLQRRKAEREAREGKQSQSSPSGAKRTSAGKPSSPASSGRNLTAQSSTPRNAPRPARTNPLQGKPNVQQPVAQTPAAAPLPVANNKKKIALVVGGVLLLGIAVYFYSKRNK